MVGNKIGNIMILKIGKEIKKPTLIYKLVVTNMHGDADGFSDATIMIEEETEVIKIINFLNWYVKVRPVESSVYQEIEKVFGKEDLPDWMCWDSTCCDCIATPRFSSLTYFDKDGKEFKVNIIPASQY